MDQLLDLLLLKGKLEGSGFADALGEHPELLLVSAAKGKVDLAKELLQGRTVQVCFADNELDSAISQPIYSTRDHTTYKVYMPRILTQHGNMGINFPDAIFFVHEFSDFSKIYKNHFFFHYL